MALAFAVVTVAGCSSGEQAHDDSLIPVTTDADATTTAAPSTTTTTEVQLTEDGRRQPVTEIEFIPPFPINDPEVQAAVEALENAVRARLDALADPAQAEALIDGWLEGLTREAELAAAAESVAEGKVIVPPSVSPEYIIEVLNYRPSEGGGFLFDVCLVNNWVQKIEATGKVLDDERVVRQVTFELADLGRGWAQIAAQTDGEESTCRD